MQKAFPWSEAEHPKGAGEGGTKCRMRVLYIPPHKSVAQAGGCLQTKGHPKFTFHSNQR